MRLSLTLAMLPALGLAFTEDDYQSGRVHEIMMQNKLASWDHHRDMGDYRSKKWNSWSKWQNGPGRRGPVRCRNGLAVAEYGSPNQTFKCNNIDMYDFVSHADLGSFTGEGSDSFGWVSNDGREFVAIGQADGTAFAEITRKGKLVYLGRLPQQSVFSIWHDMKAYKNYMLIGSEAVGHGIQIFDMEKLIDLDPSSPVNFSTTNDLTGFFEGLPVGRSHNVVVNQELGYAAAVGAQPRNDSCAGGLIYIDLLTDITNPTSPGCAGQDGYIHDAQCLVYHGPDKRHEGVDICYGFNEDTLTIYDATEKSGVNSSKIISRTPYYGATYSHQGWVLDPDNQEFLLLNDELDELEMAGHAAEQHAITYIWDIRDLENPINTGYYKNVARSIDHNLYVDQGLATLSNYGSGLRILDVSGIPEDPSGGNVEEVAFFDIYPEDDAQGGLVDFVGTWSHYVFPSGYIFVNTIERGGFVLKMSKFSQKGRGKWWKSRKD